MVKVASLKVELVHFSRPVGLSPARNFSLRKRGKSRKLRGSVASANWLRSLSFQRISVGLESKSATESLVRMLPRSKNQGKRVSLAVCPVHWPNFFWVEAGVISTLIGRSSGSPSVFAWSNAVEFFEVTDEVAFVIEAGARDNFLDAEEGRFQ